MKKKKYFNVRFWELVARFFSCFSFFFPIFAFSFLHSFSFHAKSLSFFFLFQAVPSSFLFHAKSLSFTLVLSLLCWPAGCVLQLPLLIYVGHFFLYFSFLIHTGPFSFTVALFILRWSPSFMLTHSLSHWPFLFYTGPFLPCFSFLFHTHPLSFTLVLFSFYSPHPLSHWLTSFTPIFPLSCWPVLFRVGQPFLARWQALFHAGSLQKREEAINQK